MRRIVLPGALSLLVGFVSSGFAMQCDSCGVSYSTGYPPASVSYGQHVYSQNYDSTYYQQSDPPNYSN